MISPTPGTPLILSQSDLDIKCTTGILQGCGSLTLHLQMISVAGVFQWFPSSENDSFQTWESHVAI
jgi:hypothetical protein